MNIAIILAAGKGTRVGGSVPKQFIEFNGKPVLAYTAEIFEQDPNIDSIEIVCHKDWVPYVRKMAAEFNLSKVRWLTEGGSTFQESVVNGVFSLRESLSPDDIAVISFGAAPMTPREDIDDSIRVCREHGNGIAARDIDLCTCIKDDEYGSSQSIIRENLKGFANPWTFRYGELCEAYDTAIARGMLGNIEPHTTSLYFALGKRLWFSRCTSPCAKITTRQDLELFEGYLLLKDRQNRTE